MITVEGLGSTKTATTGIQLNPPHEISNRFSFGGSSQCGFCTPGIVMSLYSLLRNNPDPSEEEIAESFDGNLCRCTGYKPIFDAANSFSKEEKQKAASGGCGRKGGCCKENGSKGCGDNDAYTDKEIDMNRRFTPEGFELKPYNPDQELIFPPKLMNYELEPLYYGNEKKVWFRPVTKQQLLDIKHAYPDAKLVGGASEIQIEIKMKAADYNISVFANDVDELKQIRHIPGVGLEFGANIALTTLEHKVKELADKGPEYQIYQCISEQLKYFAGRQIRNAATPAGNIATASPISDLNPVLVAAGAILTVESVSDGAQELSMDEFFVGYRKTKMPSHAIITKIMVPETQPREVVRTYKQSKRKDDDIAIVTGCFRIILDSENKITKARLVYGGVGPFTVAAKETAKVLEGQYITDDTHQQVLESAIDALAKEFNMPYSVPGGMASYRRTLVTSFFYKFYNELLHQMAIGEADANAFAEVTRVHRPTGSRKLDNPFQDNHVGTNYPHQSALKQSTGEAVYIDDMPPFHGETFAVQVLSTHARAKILSIDNTEALNLPGVQGWVDINDLPNKEVNYWAPTPVGSEPFFADEEVFTVGQCIGVVVAEDREIAAHAARLVKVEYQDMDAIITIEQAIDAESFFDHQPQCIKGDPEEAFKTSEYVFEGTARMGSQEHFYLETQGCIAVPEAEDDEMKIYSSSQNPTETQAFAAQILDVPINRIVAKVKRLGGGFGGKESRCCQLSSLAALAAKKFNRPVRMILSRAEDMLTAGQRHPFVFKYKVGLDKNYKFTALKTRIYANAGWSMDLTKGVIERAVLHAHNCYDFPNADIKAFPCKTNIASNTAFRGFGGPQGMWNAESIIYDVCSRLPITADELRQINYLVPGQTTPYKQPITNDWTVQRLVKEVKENFEYDKVRKEVDEFNKKNKWVKRGVAHVPTAFGVSFGAAFLNQGGCLIHIYAHGNKGHVTVATGATEMGQGVYIKVMQTVAQELNVPMDEVFISETSTDKVPNSSATAASTGSDLNCAAAKNACDVLNERLKPYREKLGAKASMGELAHAAYFDRISLSATGFYKTPEIGYVWGAPDPKPAFYYYTQGSAASLVEVNTLTGDWSCLRTDIMMDIGRPINQAIDYGQIEGAYVQGQGLFTIEESLWLQNGKIFTTGPGAYKIPGFRDIPQEFNVSWLQDKDESALPQTIYRSKGVGEPPLFMGSVVYFAIRDALDSARASHGKEPIRNLPAPITTERIRNSVGDWLSERGTIEPTEGDNKSFFLYA